MSRWVRKGTKNYRFGTCKPSFGATAARQTVLEREKSGLSRHIKLSKILWNLTEPPGWAGPCNPPDFRWWNVRVWYFLLSLCTQRYETCTIGFPLSQGIQNIFLLCATVQNGLVGTCFVSGKSHFAYPRAEFASYGLVEITVGIVEIFRILSY